MEKFALLLRAALALGVMLLIATPTAAAHPGQHGLTDGHLLGDGAWGKIDLVGSVRVHDAETGLIADVAVDPDLDYAYLARWGGEACAGPEGGGKDTFDGGVYVIDIRDDSGNLLDQPVEVGFIPTHQDTLVGEGMQVIHLDTTKFTGDVLLMNHEQCGKNGKGGLSLWNVTNPLKPKKLHEHFGDITIDGARDNPDVNQTHSGFMWQAGDRAYLVATDDEEAEDVDIFDITDPKHPKLIAEFDLNEFDVSQPDLGLTESFLHDMVVKQLDDGRFIMLLSYWDGGWVMLDVSDPTNPIFLGDSDYPPTDPEVAGVAPPEGNAHQAEFTINNQFVIGTDEDFDPFRFTVNSDDGGAFRAKTGTQTTDDEATAISGTTVFVGRACVGDEAVPTAPNVGTAQIAVVERGLCTFEEKALNVLGAGGYEAMIIMNREGADACNAVFSPFLTADIPTLLIGRESGYALFGVEGEFDLDACLEGTALAPIEVGTIGDVVTSVEAQFDAWGYVHLLWVADFDAATDDSLFDVDTFAIPEALNLAFAEGFGDLSVHEVAVDPQDPSLAYLSYYSGGLRAIRIQCAVPLEQVDTLAEAETCQLVEVGGYLDADGNNFWGVETFVDPITGETIILASDRDSGLWVFRDP